MLIGLLVMEGGEIRNCGGRDGCDATEVGVSELGATKEEEARS